MNSLVALLRYSYDIFSCCFKFEIFEFWHLFLFLLLTFSLSFALFVCILSIPQYNNDYYAPYDDERTLCISEVPNNTTITTLQNIFPGLTFAHADIKIVNGMKGSVCVAFITFLTSEDADAASGLFRDTDTVTFPDGTISKVGWTKQNTRLHVSNLDSETTEADLIDLFAKYGKMVEIDPILVIKKPSQNPVKPNQICCYGVIHFVERSDAENAKNGTHGIFFGGRRLRVEWNRPSMKLRVGASAYPYPMGDMSTSDMTKGNYNGHLQGQALPTGQQAAVLSLYVQFETMDPNLQVGGTPVSATPLVSIHKNMCPWCPISTA